jgi:hypothetical protein
MLPGIHRYCFHDEKCRTFNFTREGNIAGRLTFSQALGMVPLGGCDDPG